MGEFDEYAKRLSEVHSRKTEEHQEKGRREREEWLATYEVGKKAIEQEVLPLIEQATTACGAQGLRTESTNNWTHGRGMVAGVEFQVFGPKELPHDRGPSEVWGHKILITHDGKDFKARVSNRAIWVDRNKDYESRGLDGVNEAIRVAMESVYEAMSPDTR